MSDFLAGFYRSLRTLGRTPWFTLGAVLTLALGMAGAIVFFGAFHGALLRTPPYPHSERLYQVVLKRQDREMLSVSAIPVREMAAACPAVEALGVYTNDWGRSELEVEGVRKKIPTAWVDAELMAILGNPMALGTGFQPVNFATGDGVVLTHRFWKERLGGDPAILGRTLPMVGKAQTVVGILGPDFELPFFPEASLLRPLEPLGSNRRGEFRFTALARLRQGVAPSAVEGVFGAMQKEQLRQFPRNTIADASPALVPLHKAMASIVPTGFLLVCSAAALLLVLAAANVAALFLNRAAARDGDTAVRISLGASRWQVLADSLPEGLIVSFLASGLGLLVATQAGGALRAWLPGGEQLHGLGHAWTHPAVTGFSLLLVAVLGLLLGSMQTLQVRGLDLERLLRGNGSQAHATHRVRDGLVVAQLALATTLLFGSVLLGRSLYHLLVQPTGITTVDLQVVDLESIKLNMEGENLDPGPLLQHLEARPGIRKAALARAVPTAWEEGPEFVGYVSLQSGSLWSVNASTDPGSLETSNQQINYDFVSEGYPETLGLRVIQGRTLSREDIRARRKVCVLDQRAAQRFFPDGALGREFYLGIGTAGLKMGEPLEVIGVVASFRALAAARPEVPYVLLPAGFSPPMRILVRSSLSLGALRQEVAQALITNFPNARIRKVVDVDGLHWRQALPRRQVLALIIPFTGLALLMAALGLGTLIGSQVVQRTRELGIRSAIGAGPGRLLTGVMRGALLRVFLGIALGLGISLACSRVLQSMLYGVETTDLTSLVGASSILLATAFLSALPPALRAARTHPAQALRW
jgi:predicted permease